MSQRYNDNTKRPQPQDTQLGFLKFMYFAQKFSRGPPAHEGVLLGLPICPWEYAQKVAAFPP